MDKKYCRYCGELLIEDYVPYLFDEKTGERTYELYMTCPKRSKDTDAHSKTYRGTYYLIDGKYVYEKDKEKKRPFYLFGGM